MEPPRPGPKRRPAAWFRYAQASSVGLEMGLSVAVGVAAGLYLERRFGGAPWVGLAGLAFGIGAAVLAVVQASQRQRRDAEAGAAGGTDGEGGDAGEATSGRGGAGEDGG